MNTPDILQQPPQTAFHMRDIETDPRITTVAAALRAAAEYPIDAVNSHGLVVLEGRGTAKRLSYAELWAAARTAAKGLRARGLQAGDRMLLLLPTSEDYVITLCGALILGVVPCTVAAPTSRSKADDALRYLGYIYDKLDPALVVVPEMLQETLQAFSGIDPRRVITAAELQGAGMLDVDELPMLSPDQPLHIQLTSGTTNRPKGVVLSQSNVVANLQAIGDSAQIRPSTDRFLSWLPLYHDMGFIQLLLVMYYQMDFVLMTPMNFLREPLSWLQNIGRYQTTITAAPTFAYSICLRKFDPAKIEGLDLSAWRRSYVGAEPVPLGILQQFTERFTPYGLHEDTLYPSYGMAETVLITSGPRNVANHRRHVFGNVVCERLDASKLRKHNWAVPVADDDDANDAAIEVLSMGRAVKGLEIVVKDERSQQVPDRTIGEICVRGTSLTAGYFQDADATAAAIRDGYYHTGDRGYMVDGDVYVLGRIKELIIVRGRNYQPFDIESVIDEHPAVRKGYTVAFGIYNAQQGTDDLVCVIETKAPLEERTAIAQDIQESLQNLFGFRAHDIVFVGHGTVPRTTSGKSQRVLSKEWYEQGKFTA